MAYKPRKKIEQVEEQSTSSENPTNRQIIEGVIEKINKTFKSNIISFADEYDAGFLLRRPTGIISLDIAI